MRHTPSIKCILMRYIPVRCRPVRYPPIEMHTCEMCTPETYAHRSVAFLEGHGGELAKTHNKLLSRIRYYSRHVILGHTCKIISHPRIVVACTVINLQILP